MTAINNEVDEIDEIQDYLLQNGRGNRPSYEKQRRGLSTKFLVIVFAMFVVLSALITVFSAYKEPIHLYLDEFSSKYVVHRDTRFSKPAEKLYTDNIYVVSMPKDMLRRGHAQSLFDTLGLDVQYVRGVDLYKDYMAVKAPGGLEHNMIAGVGGDWMAHREIWRDFLAKGYETALVLEDDVDMNMDIREQIKKGLSVLGISNSTLSEKPGLPPSPKDATKRDVNKDATAADADNGKLSSKKAAVDWDVFYVGHCGTEQESTTPVDPSFKPLIKVKSARCTFGYLINKRGVEKLLDYFGNDCYGPLDQMMALEITKGKINAYALVPSAMDHRIYGEKDTKYPWFSPTSLLNSAIKHVMRFGHLYTSDETVYMDI
ncbi:hypothetical protein H4219_003932 [Mycoemilia scoparia]|uniref:Glycosyl transferase family 25 domain-containing protein n=1 Tax=Mycoemilia scoparia TaxID=417184 RepID=A0A9W8DS80_9FUNG|nr:hypothetical protein H4219_003932 [Mycoemilia scoparia]